jgi:hypothetical protein
MLCAFCTVHMETRSTSFLVESQNQGRRFVSGFPSKPVATGFPVVTPTFYKNNFFVHIGVHIKCISICSTYEKLSKNKSCIGCIAWHGILYFSKILEESRRI